ncbi:MAG: hypothetical protein AAGA37_21490, partial [Actinomycetota bacterium]
MHRRLASVPADKAIAGLLVIAIAIAGAMTFIGRSGLDFTLKEVEILNEDVVAPAHEIKLLSDLYGLSVVDAVYRGNLGLYPADEVLAELRSARDEGPQEWAVIEEHMRAALPDQSAIWDEIDDRIAEADTAIASTIAQIEANGIDGIGEDGQMFTAIDPLTVAFEDALKMLDETAEFVAAEALEGAQSSSNGLVVGFAVSAVLLGLGGSLLFRTVRAAAHQQRLDAMDAERLSEMVNASTRGMMFIDNDGVVQYVNPELAHLFEESEAELAVAASDILGSPAAVLPGHGPDAMAVLPRTEQVRLGPKTIELQLVEITAAGERRGVMSTWRDLTEQVLAAERERVAFGRTREVLDVIQAKSAELTVSSETLTAISNEMAGGADETAAQAAS